MNRSNCLNDSPAVGTLGILDSCSSKGEGFVSSKGRGLDGLWFFLIIWRVCTIQLQLDDPESCRSTGL
jgi:hypothetical protein